MKITLPLFLFLALTTSLSSQTIIKMIPIVVNESNFRQVDALALDSITIDCPTTGKVFVRFDGNCISTPGDRIILAASNYHDWQTNDGNTDVMVVDSLHTLTCFDHTRIYDILEEGFHTFYAIGQNYVDLQGTGIASIKGHLSVLFMPDSLPDQALAGIGINDCCWNWDNNNGWTHVFPNTSIEASSSGQLLVSLEAKSFMPFGGQFLYTTNLEPTWPISPVVFPVNLAPNNEESTVLHREIFPVDAGNHAVYALVKIIGGDSISSNKYLYSTLCAQFIPDDSPIIQLKRQSFDENVIAATGPFLLGQVQFTNTLEGKAWLHLTGRFHTSLEDRIRIWMRPSNDPNSVISEVNLQPIDENNIDVAYSLSGIQDVAPGTHTYDVMVDYDNTSAGTLEGDISGLFTVQFIANPISSKVNDISSNDAFSVYPNPTNGNVCLRSSAFDNHDPFEISIINSSGQVIHHQSVSDLNQYCADLSGFPDGEYMVKIRQGEKVGVKPVMKMRSKE